MSKTRKTKRAATAEERAAIEFEAVQAQFTWTDEDFNEGLLVPVRMATRILQRNRKGLRGVMDKIVRSGIAPDVLNGFIEARENFKGLAETMDVAILRAFLVLEDLGYDPDNPPPSRRVNVIQLQRKGDGVRRVGRTATQ